MIYKRDGVTFYEYDWKESVDVLIKDMVAIINTPTDITMEAKEIDTGGDNYVIAVYPITKAHTDETLYALWISEDEV